ncbi:Glycosylphosphatidylinositol (GPI) anchor assembly protein [Aspergillus melleus]|uniref:Glycosylphosphatidylinositol (GPI) anchor assembly protein n=1 Tax=Aspergillus melleus TaxID=138277 RepID=A0ACC3B5H0_9EURO|nr:Glycosylphosphatidylinositol (GPI) anchor assembly protein [Aspergillus melleus]
MTSTPTSPSTYVPPASPAIPVLPTPLAQTYVFIHPCLLLGILALRFQSLTTDPVAELLNDLPLLALLQVIFVMICLPPAGSVLSSKSESAEDEKKDKVPASPSGGAAGSVVLKPGKVGYRRRGPKNDSSSGSFLAKLIPALLSLILTFLLATPVFAALLVLFGAPITTHHWQTLLCAAHMALLTSTGLIYVHGVDGSVWKEVWGAARPLDVVWGGALGTGLGAWLGAVPIPLDWDRPWQAYPITILVGAYIGYALGVGLGRTVLFGKRIDFEEEGEGKKVD